MNDINDWKAGDDMSTGAEGWQAHIDLDSGKGVHWAAVAVYGKDQDEACRRRNFILRAVHDFIGGGRMLDMNEMEQLAAECGIARVKKPRTLGVATPECIIGTWEGFKDFVGSVPALARTQAYRFKNAVRTALGSDAVSLRDEELLETIRALKAGKPPAIEPSDEMVQAFVDSFHEAATNDSVSYQDAVKAGIKAALAKA